VHRALQIAIATLLAAVCIAVLSPVHSHAQGGGESEPLLLAVWDAPPFLIKRPDGSWKGMSIELWEEIAKELELEYELREYGSFEQMMEAVESGDADVLPGIAGLERFEVSMDLSHSYYQSGSGIAVAAQPRGTSGWPALPGKLASRGFVGLVGLLLALWMAAGTVVWLFERGRNHEMFGAGLTGIGDGIWWAAVTMTTVGYGDHAPKTLGGRAIAVVWMLASIVLIASFTATITTSLTIDQLRGKVRGLEDLHEVRVGAVAGSEAGRFLGELGIATKEFEKEREALLAVAAGEIDAFVHNVMILRYLARHEFSGRVRVLPSTFDPYQVKIGLPTGSSLREPLNRVILKIVDAGDWKRRVVRYIGADP